MSFAYLKYYQIKPVVTEVPISYLLYYEIIVTITLVDTRDVYNCAILLESFSGDVWCTIYIILYVFKLLVLEISCTPVTRVGIQNSTHQCILKTSELKNTKISCN
uniref:Uncharacterized protein n=1 Tax=Cacopsylla melanoneura TaxID=428564 RepID=A0A8D9E6G8_9HEMI